MELRSGYKQTDVGMIPKDWELVSFRDAFDFLRTAAYSKAQLSDNGVAYYVHYGDIHTKWNHFLDFDKNTLPTISKEQLKNYHLLKDGDLIMVDASEDYDGVSKCVEVKNIGLKKAISGLHTFLLRDNNNKFVDGYKGYIYLNNIVKKQLDKLATGLKVYGVSKTNLKLIQIPLPPTKVEQKAIANALGDADALIQSLEKLITKKRLVKQGAMQELLKPKDGWQVKRLGEIAFFINGKAHEQFIDDDGDYIVVNSKFISTEGEVFKNASISLCPLNIGDITMVMSDIPNGRALAKCFIIPKNEKYTLNQRICALRTENLDTIFLASIISRNKYFLAFDSGTGQTNLKKQDVLECPISFPPTKKEQNHIAAILSDMDAEISTLETKLAKYKQIKQGMMQELLTGKTRLI